MSACHIPLPCSNYPLKNRCQFVWCMYRGDRKSGIELLLHLRAGMLTYIHCGIFSTGYSHHFSRMILMVGGGNLLMFQAVQRTWNFIARLTCSIHSETINLRSTASQLITHGSVWECTAAFLVSGILSSGMPPCIGLIFVNDPIHDSWHILFPLGGLHSSLFWKWRLFLTIIEMNEIWLWSNERRQTTLVTVICYII